MWLPIGNPAAAIARQRAGSQRMYAPLTKKVAGTFAFSSSSKIRLTLAGAYPSSNVRATTRSVRGPW